MSSRSSLLEPLALMQIALGLFFAITGLLFLVFYNSAAGELGRAFAGLAGKNTALNLVIAIIQLASGAALLLGLFGIIPDNIMKLACLAILILWVIQIIMAFFINNFLDPKLLQWLQALSADLIVLAGIWGVSSRYS